MLYGQTKRNRKWEIQDGGLLTSITYTSACKKDSNDIPTAILMLSRTKISNKDSDNVDQTERNRKWKI